ncbi:MAG: excinuclease ABC subunit UvrB [Chitinophagaceae bacterium]
MFELVSKYAPAGDQPEAIYQLTQNFKNNNPFQTLFGVTGSGKTFTIANVIKNINKPTLVITHNKTLVAQLYGEFKQFFPHNAVGYFVSYYDYYQPEAYLPLSNTYIEKDLNINEELDKLRLQAISLLLSGRRDIIIVASVSCIYGMGNPEEVSQSTIRIYRGQKISRQSLLLKLVNSLYMRTEADFLRGSFLVKGDTLIVNLPYVDYACRIVFFDDEIENIETIKKDTFQKIEVLENAAIFPANLYVAPQNMMQQIIHEIQDELLAQTTYFKSIGKYQEAQRLEERVNFDIEMMRELGYCKGIENYSRFVDRRSQGSRPFCLLDYFPKKDFLCVIDESHQTIPQIRGMHGGDTSRKIVLVEHGFRLPSAMDNRPLNFSEFQELIPQTIFISATPGDFELETCGGEIIEQVVRPTGLLDPPIEVRPSLNQIDDLLEEVDKRIKKEDKVLITTLTKRMAEELHKFLDRIKVKSKYIHSDIDAMERVEILRSLRLGDIDVLIGVNLLREGLDLPEVSLVAILDADKEGFLRNEKSLTQTAGRAARNANGLVIFYADQITQSMQKTIDETNRRREKQIAYNIKHHITPKTIYKSKEEIFAQSAILNIRTEEVLDMIQKDNLVKKPSSIKDKEKYIVKLKKEMLKASKQMNFMEAARLRDEIKKWKL